MPQALRLVLQRGVTLGRRVQLSYESIVRPFLQVFAQAHSSPQVPR